MFTPPNSLIGQICDAVYLLCVNKYVPTYNQYEPRSLGLLAP